jgi:cytochrome c oxidase subunit 2
VGKLFAAILVVITVISTVIFIRHVWWLPPDISVLGVGIDHQLMETMTASGVLFVAAQLVLAAFVWGARDTGDGRKVKYFPGGPTPMVVGASVLVAAEIVVLSLVGTKVWGEIFLSPPDPQAIHIDVQAEQFAFYFRYPGPDGKFGKVHPDLIDEGSGNYFGLDPANDTAARDDIISASLVVPVNRPILLTLHSKDVGHSLFIPELRIQQDFLPGVVIPVQFTAREVAKPEIVCTQLCGLGHFNMRAYLEVKPDSAYQQWLTDQSSQ